MRRRVLIVVYIAAAAVGGLIVAFRPPPDVTAVVSPSPAAAQGPGAGRYERDGYGFDYPDSWAFYPIEPFAASFFTVIGYLSSQPIDTSAMCTRTSNSVSCNFRGYDLGPGQVAIEIAAWGMPMSDPLEFWDRPAEGRRIVVGGMPAIESEDRLGPDHVVRTWKIARPDVMDNWIQLDADIQGPGAAASEAAVQALVNSFRFDQPPIRLDPADGAAIGNAALQQLRADQPEAFACYPPVGQRVRGSVTAAPGGPALLEPLEATCSTTIVATDIGFWRLELVIAWGDDPANHTFRYTTVQWLKADGGLAARGGSGDDLPNCCRS